MGKAGDTELVNFQKIIDQLNVECRTKQTQVAGPPPEQLFVDGRTVKYFADEVRTIIDVVLHSNPLQKSVDLRPPPGSNPLVVLLVKAALEDQRTRDTIRRIAEGRPTPKDGQDLKDTLDKLYRDMKAPQRNPPQQIQQAQSTTGGNNSVANGQNRLPLQQPGQGPQTPNPQALRSKGPPPAPKPEISAIVLDFGTGDRYLFPKFSILDYVSAPPGQQVVVSFLLVRKGSFTDYGGDPELDYYQPVTIRMSTSQGRALDNLSRAVAPRDEVVRYMDDVMDNMTRSEFLLIAMRLPRITNIETPGPEKKEKEVEKPRTSSTTDDPNQTKRNSSTPNGGTPDPSSVAKPPAVLWTTPKEPAKAVEPSRAVNLRQQAEEETQVQYQRLIQSVTAKTTEAV